MKRTAGTMKRTAGKRTAGLPFRRVGLLFVALAVTFLGLPGQAVASGENPLDDVLGHVVHREVLVPLEIGGLDLSVTNHVLFMLIAAVLVCFLTLLAARGAAKQGNVPRGLRNAIEAMIVFFQENFIFQYLGKKDGKRFTPYLLTIFFFIVTMNLVGLVPGSTTATANINVTAGLALVTFSVMLMGGMKEQGAGAFWLNLIPHGVPVALKPLLFVIEVIGLFAKIFALTVRLFANMTAGHIVLFVLIAFIIVFKQMFFVVIPASVAGATAIYCLEVFVAFLQAYIFTFLSTVFIGAALHPEH